MPMNPSAPISAMSSGGIFLFSSISAALGRTLSRANSRAVFCASSCSSVSETSNPASLRAWAPPPPVLVLVVMLMVIRCVDADEPAVRIASEEVIPVEVADDAACALCPIVRCSHVEDPDTHDEAGLRPDLLRRLGRARLVHDDLRVRRIEPAGDRLHIPAQSHELAVE